MLILHNTYNTYINLYTYIYIYNVYVCIIYVYIERERKIFNNWNIHVYLYIYTKRYNIMRYISPTNKFVASPKMLGSL